MRRSAVTSSSTTPLAVEASSVSDRWPLGWIGAGAIALLMATISSSVTALLWILLVLVAGRSSLHALVALWFGWLLTFVNPGLVELGVGSAIRWVLLLVAFIRIAWDSFPLRPVNSIGWLAAFGLVAGAASLQSSPAPVVSILKLIAFLTGVAAILIGSSYVGSTARDGQRYRGFVVGVLAAVVGLSAVLVGMEFAYLRNGTGLQGILNHPQAFGVVCVPFFLWGVFGAVDRRSPLTGLLGLTGGALLLMSEARTAGLAAVVGLLVGCGHALLKRRPTSGRRLALGAVAGALAISALTIAGITGPVDSARDFVFKGGRIEDIEELNSREVPVRESMANLADNPFLGIGFGIPSDQRVDVDSQAFGLPTGASTEKGVVYSAVLEETGLVGGFLFAGLLWSLLRRAWRRDGSLPVALVAGMLATNLGEATLTAIGGMGLFVWLVIAAAITFPDHSSNQRLARGVALASPQDPSQRAKR